MQQKFSKKYYLWTPFLTKGSECDVVMSPQLKCHQNWNVTKTEMPPNIKYHQKLNGTKNDMAPKREMSPKLNVARTEMFSKLKCYQEWNITRNEITPNLEFHLKHRILGRTVFKICNECFLLFTGICLY